MWFLPSINLCIFIIASWSIEVTIAGVEEAKLVFHHGQNKNIKQIYELDEAAEILNHPKFDSNRNIVLYIHGYNEKTSAKTVQMIVDAYIKRDAYNILILDWSTLADGIYPTAVRKSMQLGPKLAEVFIELFDKGMQSAKLHIVGHSLGAQLAGQIGRTITEKSNGLIKLQRISALDPALLQYYPAIGGTKAISANDAVLVDIIHTDGGLYGTPFSTGTVDFWPNGGRRLQPGCPDGFFILLSENDLCSHQRSVALWAESIANPSSTFYATHRKNKSVKIQMGISCCTNNSRRGDYDLNTNARSLYSRST